MIFKEFLGIARDRLQVIQVEVPPLRERPEDVPFLARHFAEEARQLLPDPSQGFPLSEEDLVRLEAARWPGNVRQLRNVVRVGILISGPSLHQGAPAGAC